VKGKTNSQMSTMWWKSLWNNSAAVSITDVSVNIGTCNLTCTCTCTWVLSCPCFFAISCPLLFDLLNNISQQIYTDEHIDFSKPHSPAQAALFSREGGLELVIILVVEIDNITVSGTLFLTKDLIIYFNCSGNIKKRKNDFLISALL